ncbi:methyltransferase [Alloscardovia macacae]|uniref:tRNA (adenine(58)-N(1))-methyltransferase TrmI n=1 Tax=Alloscardovia macacae TaxID=1160091 RepID=A0A1Y2SVN5_9BIFI|nr:tRNA (adenine-N1)-methyltransferase [Alloscardovia macacae]OTA25487.1 methyltransferase [Alloscardovia macacae]OTA30135.1 methyltransferase [Alloscardovia macacae]
MTQDRDHARDHTHTHTHARGPLAPGEKVQLTDRKGNMLTFQLVGGGVTDTQHGQIHHDDILGQGEGRVIETHAGSSTQAQDAKRVDKPWKTSRKIGGWQYVVMRPRMADYVLSMPRGAQIMYPKDIATVLELGDIRTGQRVLESGGGSGAMSLHLLEAVGESGELTTIEMRPDFARICAANASLFFGFSPSWWRVDVGDFDSRISAYPDGYFDRIVLDQLDPWNRLEEAYRVIAPGGVLTCYVTTTTQLSRVVEKLAESGHWTQPHVQESLERSWKVDGLAVRPDHSMIGHTGFLVFARAMAPGFIALKKREKPTKANATDIDETGINVEELELRDMSDRKLRKVLRDLDSQLNVLNERSM